MTLECVHLIVVALEQRFYLSVPLPSLIYTFSSRSYGLGLAHRVHQTARARQSPFLRDYPFVSSTQHSSTHSALA